VLGLDGAHRMNLPGTGAGNWCWRFEWPMLHADAATWLGRITLAAGRAG
jgi:4-alpha-glucanotransferase